MSPSDAGALRPAAPDPPAVPGMLTPEPPLSEVALEDAAEAVRDAEAAALDATALAEASREERAVMGVKTAEDAEAARVTEDAPAPDAVLALMVGLAVAEPVAEPAPTYQRD